jgi:hypothetical protein
MGDKNAIIFDVEDRHRESWHLMPLGRSPRRGYDRQASVQWRKVHRRGGG